MELSIILLWVLLLLLLLLLDAKSFWKHSLARRSLEGQSRKAPACQVGRQTREGVWPPDTVGARSLGEESWAWTQAPPAPAVRPWGFVPSWCPHPWMVRLGTSPAEIIADTPCPGRPRRC